MQFTVATLLPVTAAALIALAQRRTSLSKLGYWQQQVLYGLVFGTIAIFGTEAGIKTYDATMNVRDAAPIVAGLYFGGPAGIIAGVLGGVERWFAALWGKGMFTRLACSVATIASGVYAALISKYLLERRKPTWTLALSVGMIAEVLHLLLVFLTNIGDATRAFRVVQACTVPMVLCNGISVALASLAMAIAGGERLERPKVRDISQEIQSGMLGVVAIAFVGTVAFTFAVQQSTTYANTNNQLSQEIDDIEDDIHDTSDQNLLTLARRAADAVPRVSQASNESLAAMASVLHVSEVHAIDAHGMIVASSDSSYVGYNMSSGVQSRAFLDLLPSGRSTYYVQDYQPMAMDPTQWRKFAGVRVKDGFIQVSYDSTLFHEGVAAEVSSSISNRHVGRNGFLVVFDESGSLVGSIAKMSSSTIEGSHILEDSKGVEHRETFATTIGDVDYVAMREDVESFTVIALIPVEEANESRDLSVLIISYMEVLILAALFVALFVLVRHMVVNSIWEVNDTLQKITSGDLEATVEVRGSTEFSSLSDDINRTVGALRDAIAAEAARNDRDLATAKAIQESALPRTFPPFPDIDAFDIYASMNAAREVGGDFYDFFLVDDHTLGFLIADVSGKGIPASLFMMAAKTELANYMTSGMDLAEAVHSANLNLCRGNDAGMFVTLWAAKLDFATGLLTYVNAGHNPPLLRHEGTWQWLKERGGLFLGTFETAKYHSNTITLVPGDELLLYTDGVNEAFNAAGEEYGNERLETFLGKHENYHPHVLINALRLELRQWSNGAEQSDDITMLCLEYGTSPEVSDSFEVSCNNEGFSELMRRLHYELAQLQCPKRVQAEIDVVVEELFYNVYSHGYKHAERPGKLEISYIYNANPSTIVVSMTDWGVPFDPATFDLSDKEHMHDEDSGIGLALIHSYVDDIAYVREEHTNVVAFKKTWT